MNVTDLAVVRAQKLRARKATDDGRCPTCGRWRVVCSPEGRVCVYVEAPQPTRGT